MKRNPQKSGKPRNSPKSPQIGISSRTCLEKAQNPSTPHRLQSSGQAYFSGFISLRTVDEVLQSLGPKKFFSTLDIAAGYRQNCQKMPSGRAPSQHLKAYMSLLPCGLCGSPAVFQRLMSGTSRVERQRNSRIHRYLSCARN